MLIADLPITTGEVARFDLFDDKLTDVADRQGGEDALAIALQQRASQTVHCLDGTIEVFILESIEESVHDFEILVGLLLQTVIAREEGSQRGKQVEHGLDVLLAAADPKQILTLVDTDLLDDLLDDNLAAGGEQSSRIGETEDMLACDSQFLEEHLVGIVASGVEKGAAIEMTKREITGYDRKQVIKIIEREVAIVRSDEQMPLATECLAMHTLTELVVDLQLFLVEHVVTDLCHSGALAQTTPIKAIAVDDGGKDVLSAARQAGLWFSNRCLQFLVEREGHLDKRVVMVVTNVKHIAARQPEHKTHQGERNGSW